MTDNRVSRTEHTTLLSPDNKHFSAGIFIFCWPGLCGGSAQPPDLLDERNPGPKAMAQMVPRHHRHEQDEAAQLRLQMTLSRAGQVREAGKYFKHQLYLGTTQDAF